MFDWGIHFNFEFDIETFQADTQALAPSAMPQSQKGITIKKIARNFGIIAFLFGFVFLYTSIFGGKNAASAISIATAMITFTKMDMGIRTSHAPIVIMVLFLFTGFASHCGTWNPFLGIAVNFIAIFLTVTFSCQSVVHRVYLPFIVCYIFSQGNPVEGRDFWMRMVGLFFGGILTSLVYLFFHRGKHKHQSILNIVRDIHPTSMRTRFALRLAFSLTLAMFIGDIFGLIRTAWICMTINSLVLPFLHETRSRFPRRILAQIPAAIIVFLFFELFLPRELFLVGLFFTSFLYMFTTHYFTQQIFVGINALVGALAFTDASHSIIMRVLLVLLGAAIVVVTNVIAIYINPITLLKKLWERHRLGRAVHKLGEYPVHSRATGHHRNYRYRHKRQRV